MHVHILYIQVCLYQGESIFIHGAVADSVGSNVIFMFNDKHGFICHCHAGLKLLGKIHCCSGDLNYGGSAFLC